MPWGRKVPCRPIGSKCHASAGARPNQWHVTFREFCEALKVHHSRLLRFNSVNMTCTPAAKSDLTENLPLPESGRFAGLAPAICRVGCGVHCQTNQTGDLACFAFRCLGSRSGWKCAPRRKRSPPAAHNCSAMWGRMWGQSEGYVAKALIKGSFLTEIGCPARIRTSIDGVRVRSLTFRRRGNSEPAL